MCWLWGQLRLAAWCGQACTDSQHMCPVQSFQHRFMVGATGQEGLMQFMPKARHPAMVALPILALVCKLQVMDHLLKHGAESC